MTRVVERPRPAVAVDELQRAWQAVQAGAFRHTTTTDSRQTRLDTPPPDRAPLSWAPGAGERVLPVVGCVGAAGASVTALAIATAAEIPLRVVECSSVTASGLAAAASAELGAGPSGWTRGTRGRVLVERVGDVLADVGQVPIPTVPDRQVGLTVVDAGWELGGLLATECWLGALLRAAPVVVAVTIATIPGLRRLEGALELLGPDRVVAGVVGPRRRRWPRGVEPAAGPRTRVLLDTGGLVEVPADRGLAVSGLDSAPLPQPVLAAAARLLDKAADLDPGCGAGVGTAAADNHEDQPTEAPC